MQITREKVRKVGTSVCVDFSQSLIYAGASLRKIMWFSKRRLYTNLSEIRDSTVTMLGYFWKTSVFAIR